jgi:polysaccharide export outer membrane protein
VNKEIIVGAKKQVVLGMTIKSRAILSLGVGWILFCPALQGQVNDRGGDRTAIQPVYTPVRRPDASELAKDNYSRVAASSIQIRAVLVRDAGLLVELKRWVAKEATDNGQIVEDSDLSEQAIFERLDRDIAFRSVATRLLQRYGYLIPATNPDSNFGKEEEFILKERARRLVALENRDDTNPPRIEKEEGRESDRASCDPRQESCDNPVGQRPRIERTAPNAGPSQEVPPSIPTENPLPDFSLSPSRTLRADSSSRESGFNSVAIGAEPELMPSALKSGGDSLPNISNPNVQVPQDGLANRRLDSWNDRNSQMPSGARDGSAPQGMQGRQRRYDRYGYERPDLDVDVNPVKMVRPANPYADVPSLYDMYVQAAAWQRPAQQFGLEIFRNTVNQPDIIPMDLPVGPDYVVGPGDSLSIDLWGGVSQRMVRVVDREGRVSLPEAGPVLVSGKSLGEVQFAVQRVMRTQFRDVSADVSIARLRTVRVYVVGEVAAPGAYDISSLSTPLNALFAAGGITARGSLRSLKHYRGKQLVQEVDAYDLLLHGVRSDVQQLQSGDTLLISPVGPQVTIEGMVRRPAVYELLHETSLSDALQLAGGILPTAALRHIEVQRLVAHEKRTMLSLDISTADGDPGINRQLEALNIQGGDEIHIFPIASYNEASIYLQGHVLRPGRYSYKQGMRLSDLVGSYSDLLPEPAPHYGEIVRLNAPDFRPSVESFDLAAALANPAAAPTLKPLDTVRVFSRYDFEPPPDVWVGGEVHTPGKYRTAGQAHLVDAIHLAGGITQDAAVDSAQLFRTQADGTLKIMSVDLKKALAGDPIDNILLQSRDRILVHRNVARVEPATVYIKGEVAKPGRYPLATNMRVEDLVRVGGGLKRSADSDLADLTRFAASNGPGGTNQRMEVKLAAALTGDANEDVTLRDGDVLTIRQVPQWNDLGATVVVRGEVQHPASYGIEPGEKLSSVLRRSGGFTGQAYPYGAVLVRREVRELQMRSHLELVQRVKAQETYLKSLPESDADQKTAKLSAIAQTETTLQQLEATSPIGRVVVHIPANVKDLDNFAKSHADVVLQDGDQLVIPKKTNYVMVGGQVYSPTAVSYLPGKSAKWYLSQAGGMTQIADKNATFVVRADGSVLSSKNNSTFWSGDPMSAVLKPGDSIVVPEKAPKIGARNWAPILQAAQVASSVALTVAYIHP